MSDTFTQWSKECRVRPGINQGVSQNLAYVRVVPHTSAVLFVECMSALKIVAYVRLT